MLNSNVQEILLALGEYCHKGVPGCFCRAGWPYERQCPNCRDSWKPGSFRDSYCVCPPVERIFENSDKSV